MEDNTTSRNKSVLQAHIDRLVAQKQDIEKNSKRLKKTGAYPDSTQRKLHNLQVEIDKAKQWMESC